MTPEVTIVEVAPRDGFQAIAQFIPTQRKIAICRALVAAGVRRLEVGAFVSPRAIPQMMDVREVLSALRSGPHPELSVLVPNRRGAEDALGSGVDALVYVVSASRSHSLANVRRTPEDALAEMIACLEELKPAGRFRFNLATAFHCPFEGPTPQSVVLAMIAQVLAARPDAEIGLCDTTGYATPADVAGLIADIREEFGSSPTLAFHAHDTYGNGVASTMAAYDAGIRVLDAAVGGLGGCPFAPGASGNVATEDVAYAFRRRGVATGLTMAPLLAAASEAAAIEGAQVGGRLRAVAEGRRKTVAAYELWPDPALG